jgi:hypothetical protein
VNFSTPTRARARDGGSAERMRGESDDMSDHRGRHDLGDAAKLYEQAP